MKVSLNWISEYTNIDTPKEELFEKIGAQLGAIEDTIDLSELYKGILIVKVVSCDPHSDADKLHVCSVDDGGKNKDAKRDANGYIQIVCGAPNVAAGQLAVWLPVGTTIPETAGKGQDKVVLEAKEIRGVVSNGMLASAKELAIGDGHEGIVVINPNDAKPGDDFAEVYKLNDVVIDIENKMFTHRPDCFGELGVAREIAGITGKKFTSPEWYLNADKSQLSSEGDSLPLLVTNEIPALVPRFMAVALEVDNSKPSPFWLQTYLGRVGIRPISPVVDVTNYMMMLTAQPLHAYDYDKVKSLSSSPDKAVINVRLAKAGEKLTLLGGKVANPKPEDIMIATDSQPIGFGGVMGGADTEVDAGTTKIILECADFDMYAVRRTSMANGIFTEAVTRFNKGQSPLQNDRVLAEAVKMLKQLAAAKVSGQVFDDFHAPTDMPKLAIEASFISSRLGLDISAGNIMQILENVEFSVTAQSDDSLLVVPPFWRTDIHIKEDIVEEVGRLYGYDKLNLVLPKRGIDPVSVDETLTFKAKVRNILEGAGANELLTYSFVNGQLLEKVGQDSKLSYQLSNALSPNLQFYRLSLAPSLLEKVHSNIKAGFGEFTIFEMNKVHVRGHQDPDEKDLPGEELRLALVIAADDKTASTNYSGAAYYQAMHYVKYLLDELGIEFNVSSVEQVPKSEADTQALQPFELVRTGLVSSGDEALGLVGEPKNSVKKQLKLPKFVAMVELDLAKLLKLSNSKKYVKLSNYPKIEQDVCFKLPATTTYETIRELVIEELDKRVTNSYLKVTPLDVYQKSPDDPDKQITFRVSLNSYDKTLATSDLNELIKQIGEVAQAKLKAEIV